MSFKKDYSEKDYKLIYEATKADLDDQIARTKELEQELASIKFGDAISLRERIASGCSTISGHFDHKNADDIYNWIMSGQKAQEAAGKNKKKGKRGRPKKVMTLELAAPTRSKKRRKYTKKSKF